MDLPSIDLTDKKTTKEGIFFAAVQMFAAKGYAAVSVRDIADAVGITAASIYNHFANKKDILHEIITYTNDTIREYYKRIDVKVKNANSLEEVIDYIFRELEVVPNMSVYYGVAVLSSEQFHNDQASTALNEVYMKQGIDFIAKTFAFCINKDWIKPFDVKTTATFVMNNVYAGSLAYVQKELGREGLYDPSKMFNSLKKFLLEVLEA